MTHGQIPALVMSHTTGPGLGQICGTSGPKVSMFCAGYPGPSGSWMPSREDICHHDPGGRVRADDLPSESDLYATK